MYDRISGFSDENIGDVWVQLLAHVALEDSDYEIINKALEEIEGDKSQEGLKERKKRYKEQC